MAKKNWSLKPIDPNTIRKPHANKYAAHVARAMASEVKVTIDPEAVREAFRKTQDANHDQNYQPPIVGRTICR